MKSEHTSKIKSFTDLIAWQEAHELVKMIYAITKYFPDDQKFGLTSQMQRAAISMTANIAEGFGRQTSKDQTHFLYIASGSLRELQNYLILCRDIGYITAEVKSIEEEASRVSRLLGGLIKSSRIQKHINPETRD